MLAISPRTISAYPTKRITSCFTLFLVWSTHITHDSSFCCIINTYTTLPTSTSQSYQFLIRYNFFRINIQFTKCFHFFTILVKNRSNKCHIYRFNGRIYSQFDNSVIFAFIPPFLQRKGPGRKWRHRAQSTGPRESFLPFSFRSYTSTSINLYFIFSSSDMWYFISSKEIVSGNL